MKKSQLFTSGIFDISNLLSIKDPLKSSKFFEGGNRIILKNDVTIKTISELERIIDEELEQINETPEAKKAFKKLSEQFLEKANLKKLSNSIKKDPEFTKIFLNIDRSEDKYIIQKLNESILELDEYLNEYVSAKSVIGNILKDAQKEKRIWDKTIDTFNKRFYMPFALRIKNLKDAVLERKGMYVEFVENGNSYDQETIANVLSEGEKKALYLLEIVFTIEKIKKDGAKPILIFDDISDAFDYTNKHAIIEYLYEISKDFKMIVLTHNFDFYRHFGVKVSGRDNCYFANKDFSDSKITLQKGGYLGNVFENLYMNQIGKNKIKYDLAAIPFARGVIELTKKDFTTDTDYLFFTHLLHYRPQKGSRCRMKKLYEKYKRIFCNQQIIPDNITKNDVIYKALLNEALCASKESIVNQDLTDKIILAIALRLCCEKYMYVKLRSKNKITATDMDKLQIGDLYHTKYKNEFPKDKFNASIETVCILVPQIIHFNGFMYEPLIDFSIIRLRSLFERVYEKTKCLFHI